LVAEIYNIHGKEVMKDVDYPKMKSPDLGVDRKYTQVTTSGKERKKMEMWKGRSEQNRKSYLVGHCLYNLMGYLGRTCDSFCKFVSWPF